MVFYLYGIILGKGECLIFFHICPYVILENVGQLKLRDTANKPNYF